MIKRTRLLSSMPATAVALLCYASLHAQLPTPNFHRDTLQLRYGDTLSLSGRNLVPGSDRLRTTDGPVPRSAYWLDRYRGRLTLKARGYDRMKAVLVYQSFPSAPPDTLRHRKPKRRADSISEAEYITAQQMARLDSIQRAERQQEQFELGGLRTKGSISRSVTAGSDRDAGVNSDFRLEVEGDLTDDLQIVGAITDRNVPVQPSGTTQQISDFDQVFIQLRQDPYALTFGDFELNQTGTQFANLSRNVLGVKAERDAQHGGTASFNVSKGRFFSNTFTGENNRQGPYRLTGRDGERFLIILAGSERVYVNGQLKQRGEGNDYIIDYNTGEVTFTANQLINSNTRIVIDFEYADRQYTRTFLFGRYKGEAMDGRLRIQTSWGREADNPEAPIDLELSAEDRRALRDAGDSTAAVSGVDTVPEFDSDQILYKAVDTTANGQNFANVFVRSTDTAKARFRLTFANVGQGNGNYVQGQSSVNGNIFRWVAPDPDGTPNGDFEPVKVLPLPNSRRVLHLGLEYDLTKHLSIGTNTATSSFDANQLSPLDDDDNDGLATRNHLRLKELPLSKGLKMNAEIAMQAVNKRYQNFDRVFAKEYGRVWNFDDLGQRADELLGEGSVELLFRDKYRVKLEGGQRSYGDSLNTTRSKVSLASTDSSALLGEYSFTFLNTRDNVLNTRSRWERHNGNVFFLAARNLKLGSEIWMERRRNTSGGRLSGNSFEFYDLTPYLELIRLDKLDARLSFNYRLDFGLRDSSLKQKSTTLAPAIKWNYQPIQGLQVQHSFTFQRFKLEDESFETDTLASETTVLNNLQVNYRSENGFLETNFLYEILSEQATRRQLTFIKVNPGQGNFEWNDSNEDGVQDLDEFQRASNPLTANFAQFFTPTSELIPAVGLRSSLNTRLNFSSLTGRKPDGFWGKVMKPVRTVTSLRIREQTTGSRSQLGTYLINPTPTRTRDTSLLNANWRLKQDLFLFQNNPTGDLSFTWQEIRRQQLLTSGLEERRERTLSAEQRYNLDTDKSLEHRYSTGFTINETERLADREFDIRFHRLSPSFNYQLNRRIRLTTSYTYQNKRNRSAIDSLQAKLRAHRVAIEGNINLKERNSFRLRIEGLNNQLAGMPNQTARFELLEGLENGNNLIANATLTWYLTEVLELSMVYDGRFAAKRPTIHSGRVQLRAIF